VVGTNNALLAEIPAADKHTNNSSGYYALEGIVLPNTVYTPVHHQQLAIWLIAVDQVFKKVPTIYKLLELQWYSIDIITM